MASAYYNEHDPYAAQWLRNLIAAGHIAQGDVDERSIEDVAADDLAGYRQCHFFAGIGVWSHALRRAGWDDSRPVWTGSCPCQPFSTAGKGEGIADERHLWPAWHHLIEQCRPPVVFGEQVEAAIKHGWLDLVQADLEGIGYAFAAAGLPAAGVGAPHIRQRLWFVADDESQRRREARRAGAGPAQRPADGGAARGMDDTKGQRPGFLNAAHIGEADAQINFPANASDCKSHGSQGQRLAAMPACPTNGFWRDADWLFCRDGKWRPVEASPQPLVDGTAESLGRVRPEIIDQIEEEIDASAMEGEIRRPETVRALRQYLGAQAPRVWSPGGIPRLHEAPFLLAFLRQLEEQGWSIEKGSSLPCSETSSGAVRSVWYGKGTAGASRERGLDRQPAREPSDAVHFLSSLLARHAHKAWADAYAAYAEVGFPLGHDAPARVGRLRAYGNAIVAQVAEEMITAYMECRP